MSQTKRPGSTLALVPAILSGLILRRSGPIAEKAPHEESKETEPGFETEDVHVGRTWLVIAGLTLTVALTIGGLGWMMRSLAASQRATLPPLTRRQTAKLTPPKPNLQPTPYADIEKTLADEAARLDGYAYLDASRERARIPIERAMSLVVGKPLDR